MFGNTIKKKILTAIENKLDEAQSNYERSVAIAEDKFNEDVVALHDRLELDKQQAEETAVNSVVGKLFS